MPYSTFVRDINNRQKLWKTSEPFTCTTRQPDGVRKKLTTSYIVSSVCLPETTAIQGCPECYLFAANEHGEIIDWCEMEGSQKQTTDHYYVMSQSKFPPRL